MSETRIFLEPRLRFDERFRTTFWSDKFLYPKQHPVLGICFEGKDTLIYIYLGSIMYYTVYNGRTFIDTLSSIIAHEFIHKLLDEEGISDNYAHEWALDNVEGFLYG